MSSKTTESTGISLSSTYYLRNFYSNNRSAFKASTRSDTPAKELSHEDSLALHRAAKALGSFHYSSSENKKNITSTITAFLDTYNNTLDSASNSGSRTLQRYSKQLKKLTSKYADQLSDIGITVKSDGTLKGNDNLLSKADAAKLKKIFGKDSNYTSQLKSIGKHLSEASEDELYSQLTGNGSNINVTV